MAAITEELHLGNQDGGDHALCCPHCGDLHMHHANVTTEPDHVWIGFWCESCRKTSELEIEQHKGWTLVTLVRRPKHSVPRPAYMFEHEMPS